MLPLNYLASKMEFLNGLQDLKEENSLADSSCYIPFIQPFQIEKILADFEKGGGSLNGSLLVAQGDQVIFSQGYGFSDKESNLNNTPQTQFLIGSVTKQFTAAAVLKSLHDEAERINPTFSPGELAGVVADSLRLPLTRFIAENDPIWKGEPPLWLSEVTLDHLLSHTSGIPNFTDTSKDSLYEEFIQGTPSSVCEGVALFRNRPLEFTPGEKCQYSNSGYILLGVVLERLSGVPAEEYFRTHFFAPLGMNASFLPRLGRVPALKEEHPDLAKGYGWDLFDHKAPLKEQGMYEEMSVPYTAGAIISTVEDLHKWNVALHEAGRVLPKELLDLMLSGQPISKTPKENHYAYGIIAQRNPGTPVAFLHNGGITGYTSTLYYYPGYKLTVVTLSNVSGNSEQQSLIWKNLREKFGHLEPSEEAERLQNEYLMNTYPLMFESWARYNFGAPLAAFIEKMEG